jgi:hypothetical protein
LIARYLQSASLSLCVALGAAGWLGAQDLSLDAGAAGSEPKAEAPDIGDPHTHKFPLDVAGYLSFRTLNDDAFYKHEYYREYAGSLFLSKKAGRWLFHSEFNANSALDQRFSDGDASLDGAELRIEKGRMQPVVSLKIEADRYQSERGRSAAYDGVTAGVVYFFHLP